MIVPRPLRNAFIGFLSLLVPGPAFTSHGAAAVAETDQRKPVVHPFRVGRICDYDRLMVGPDGAQVAIWAGDARYILGLRLMLPPSDVIIGRMHERAKSQSNKFFFYSGSGLRLFPLRWSRDGDRLFVRVREPRQRILAVSADGIPDSNEIPLPQEWSATDINAISHGEVSPLNDLSIVARISRIDGKELFRGSVTLGPTVELAGVRKSNLELVRVGPRGTTDTGINSGHTRLLTIFPDNRDYANGISYLGAARNHAAPAYQPYQLPIVDLEDARVAGSFGPAEIRLDRPSELGATIGQFHRRLASEGGKIVDVSLSGRSLMALVSYPNWTERLVRLSAGGLIDKLICALRAEMVLPSQRQAEGVRPHPIQYRIFALNRQGREGAKDGAPIVVQYSMAGGGTRDAILYFQGGPGRSLSDDFWFIQLFRILTPNRDIIAVEYSGGIGGGKRLTDRLSKAGLKAVEQDVDAVAAWLRAKPYRRLYLISESFGGVPAMLALSRHRQLFSASFHIAPLLKLKDPSAWSKRGTGFNPVNADTQLAYELAAFGGDRRRQQFAKGLLSLVKDAPLGASDHFYFGAFDEVSKPTELPAGTQAKVTTFPHAGHAVLGATGELWRDIESHMQ